MKTKFILLLVVSLSGLSAHEAAAQTEQACTDLARYTCATGDYDDGTGVVTKGGLVNDPKRAALIRAHALAEKKFREALLAPENSMLRKGVLSSRGLTMRNDCKGAETEPSGKCLDLMAAELADLTFTGNPRKPDISKGVFDIDDRAFIVDQEIFQDIQKETVRTMSDELGMDDLSEKVKKIFPQIKHLIMEKVKTLVKDKDIAEKLASRINDITFSGSKCGDSGAGPMSEQLVSNAFYSPSKFSLRYCIGNKVSSTSEFELVQAIAHELSHSIDPCNITLGPKDFTFQYHATTLTEAELEYPFSNLISCLRGENSAHAVQPPPEFLVTPSNSSKRLGDDAQQMANPYYPQPGPVTGSYGYGYGYGTGAGGPPTAPTAPPKPATSLCAADQITETFADWMAYEVIPDYIAKNHPNLTAEQMRTGYSNIFRANCDDNELQDVRPKHDAHPTYKRRVDYLIAVQPEIRKQMGCPVKLPAGRQYCTVSETPVAPVSPPAGAPQLQPLGGSMYQEYKPRVQPEKKNTGKGLE